MNDMKRIMTFNTRYKNKVDGKNGWEYRKDKVVSMLSLYGFDIAGLQEATDEMIAYIDKYLGEAYNWIGVGRNDGKKEGEFCPVFYRKDQYRVIDYKTYWISEAMNVPGSKGWDSICPRIATCVLFEEIKNNRRFNFINTHFDYRPEANINSAPFLKKLAGERESTLPLVITGDFNCTRQDAAYQYLTRKEEEEERDLYDAQMVCETPHHGPSYTVNMFNTNEAYKKIDFIFINNRVRVIRHAILADHWDGRYSSDHMPAMADLTFK